MVAEQAGSFVCSLCVWAAFVLDPPITERTETRGVYEIESVFGEGNETRGGGGGGCKMTHPLTGYVFLRKKNVGLPLQSRVCLFFLPPRSVCACVCASPARRLRACPLILPPHPETMRTRRASGGAAALGDDRRAGRADASPSGTDSEDEEVRKSVCAC